MRTILATMLAVMLVTSGSVVAIAAATEPPSSPAIDLPLESERTNPDWLNKPTGDDLAREYPPLAQLLQLEGSATISCEAEVDGRVDQCRVVSEAPVGVGFGAATLRTAAFFTMKPATLDGKPIPSSVSIPIIWRLRSGMAPTVAAEAPLPAVAPMSLALARQIAALQNTATRIRDSWRPVLDRQIAVIVANGQAQAGQAALDALRQGLEDAINEAVERHAHELAVRMTQGDLRATVAYLESPSGKAWMAAERNIDQSGPTNFGLSVARAARAHLCAQTSCSPTSSPVASAGP